MVSIIRLQLPKTDDGPVTPYRKIVAQVLYYRFCSSLIVMLIFSTLVSLLLFPFGRFKYAFVSLLINSVFCLYIYKVFVRPEAKAYASCWSQIYNNIFSKKLSLAMLAHAVPALFYFFKFATKVANVPTYEIKHFERYRDMDGLPMDWALHSSFDMFAVSSTHLYGMAMVLAMSFFFLTHCLVLKQVVFDHKPASGEKGFLHVMARSFRPALVLSMRVFFGAFLVTPALYHNVIKHWYLLLSPHLAFKAAKYPVKSLDEFSFIKGCVVIPLLLLPLLFVWSFSLHVFKLVVNTRPVSDWEFLSDYSAQNTESLVTGLQADFKSTTALVAWNELLTIAEHSKRRRRPIYGENDHGVWEKVMKSLLDIITMHNNALKNNKNQKHENEKKEEKKEEPTIKEVFEKFAAKSTIKPSVHINKRKQSIFTPPEPILNPNSALEKKIHKFVSSLESKETKHTEKARALLHRWIQKIKSLRRRVLNAFLATIFGRAFSQTTDRTLKMKLHNRQTTSFAVRAVARLITHSIDEDEFGNVQDTIAPFLASIEQLSSALEHIVEHPPIDESDLGLKMHITPNTEVAKDLLHQLNASFVEVCEVFRPYFGNLNVNEKVLKRSERNLPVSESVFL